MADDSKYEVLEKIGHGSFGVIRKVKRRSDSQILCRKEISYGRMSQKEKDQLRAEISILSSLRHPNIVAYYHQEHLKSTSDIHLYMEYCGHGDLGRTIRTLKSSHKLAPEPYVWDIFAQLTTALYRCHYDADPPGVGGGFVGEEERSIEMLPKSRGRIMIIHRDLKPENVFLGEQNSVKLGDFGLSKQMTTDFASTYVGTPYYMSPEIVNAEQYSFKSDIWSLGCIIYELCALTPPFDAKTHLSLCQKIKSGRYPELPATSGYSASLKDAIALCLRVHPDRRPDTAALLNLGGMRLARLQRLATQKEQSLQRREADLATREKQLTAKLEAQRKAVEDSVNARLHREWEVKAQLAITSNTNARLAELEAQFEKRVECVVHARIQELQLTKLEFTGSTSPVRARRPSNGAALHLGGTNAAAMGGMGSNASSGATYSTAVDDSGYIIDDPTSLTLSSMSLESPISNRRVSSLRHMQKTPFAEKARLLDIASPMDIEMTEPSPMVTMNSLALSPRRRQSGVSGLPSRTSRLGRNIFAEAAVRRQTAEPADLALPDSDSDDPLDDGELDAENSPTTGTFKLPPLPTTGGLKSKRDDPFALPTHTTTAATQDPAKRPRPSLTRQQTLPPRTLYTQQLALHPRALPNPAQNAESHVQAGKAGRRDPLSTLPVAVAANRGNLPHPPAAAPQSPGRVKNQVDVTAGAPPLRSKASNLGGEAMFRAVTMGNLMKENIPLPSTNALGSKRRMGTGSPERKTGAIGMASRMVGEMGQQSVPPVWDLEDVDCPSPFLKRARSGGVNVRGS